MIFLQAGIIAPNRLWLCRTLQRLLSNELRCSFYITEAEKLFMFQKL